MTLPELFFLYRALAWSLGPIPLEPFFFFFQGTCPPFLPFGLGQSYSSPSGVFQ